MRTFYRIILKEKKAGGIKSETFFTDQDVAEKFMRGMDAMMVHMGEPVEYEAHILDAYENDGEVLMMVEHTINEATRKATIKKVLRSMQQKKVIAGNNAPNNILKPCLNIRHSPK